MTALDALPERYRVILCDIWGVIHDGVRLYPGSADRLRQWREEGRKVILITNAPRTAEAVEQQLDRIGLPRDAWNGISTSGEAGIAALTAKGSPVGFIGTGADREILEGRGVWIAENGEFTEFACTGLDDERRTVGEYLMELEDLVTRNVLMHCLNPDRIVVRGGETEPCAGALADLYIDLGGRVEWYGKPFPAIYRHALKLAGSPSIEEVIAVGDALQTDILGAARMGFDAVFVAGGIHAGESFPAEFAERNGLGDWHPVAVVDSLR
ncbi:TIGR01459 family HAD-type hydrolase [Sphingomonas daechungensis]|uniref:TIGR01459 family HAD-type hydrolase n=1 Tax=Sphingomonas daechungensis TaxID=1176646 RepID=UPI0031EE9AF4